MKKIYFLRNQSGMSLVGVLSAAGILAVVIGGMMTVTQNTLKAVRTAEVKADIQDEIFLAQTILSTESNCTANFRGLGISNSKTVFPSNSGRLFTAFSPTNYTLTGSYIFPSQNPNSPGPILLKQIDYRLQTGTSNVMVLGLHFEPRGQILGGQLRPREFPLHVVVSNGRIESCSAVASAVQATSNSRQGRGCSDSPPTGPTKNKLKAALDTICDMQSYPVADGMRISAEVQKKCAPLMGGRESYCEGLIALASAETTKEYGESKGSFMNFKDVVMKNRSGYKNAAECKAQQLFSEGDTFADSVVIDTQYDSGKNYERTTETKLPVYYTCINGRWTN